MSQVELTLFVLLGCSIVGMLGVLGLMSWLLMRSQRILMSFHAAGQNLAQMEMARAKVKIEADRAEAELIRARTEDRQAEMSVTQRAMQNGRSVTFHNED